MKTGDGLAGRRAPTPQTPDSPGGNLPAAGTGFSQEALADLVRNHHEALVRFLTLRTGSREEAQEVAQEAYARLLAPDRPGTISFLAGYVYRVAANLAVDRKRRRALGERFSTDALQSEDELEPSPESVVEARQRLAIVERAMGELPRKCLQAFSLRVLNGMKFEEAGRAMGISDRQVKTYVARALEYLQDSLDAADQPRNVP